MTIGAAPRSGFVGVEALVGLAITALVLTAATQLTLRFFRTDRILSDARSDEDALRRAHAVIRQSVERMIVGLPAQQGGPSLVGTRESLAIVSSGPTALAAAEPVRIRFEARTDGGNATLALDWMAIAGGGAQSDVLLAGAKALTFSYRANGPSAPWTERWDDPDGLPASIRLAVEYPTGVHEEITLPVRADIPARCLVEAEARSCQP
jgi:hypothetical protein